MVRGESGVGVTADTVLMLRADLETRNVDVGGRASRRGREATGRIRLKTASASSRRSFSRCRRKTRGPCCPTERSPSFAGSDYHVDWVLPDGTTKSTRLSFRSTGRRLTDEEKQKLADSAQGRVGFAHDRSQPAREHAPKSRRRWRWRLRRAARTLERRRRPVGPGGQHSANDLGSALGDSRLLPADPSRTPRWPDLDGNLWMLTTTTAQSQHGELVYDVRESEARGLFQRVRMPARPLDRRVRQGRRGLSPVGRSRRRIHARTRDGRVAQVSEVTAFQSPTEDSAMLRSCMGAAARALLLGCLVVAAPCIARAQVSTDIIRGRVTDADATPRARRGGQSDVLSWDKSPRPRPPTRADASPSSSSTAKATTGSTSRKLGFAPKRFEVKKHRRRGSAARRRATLDRRCVSARRRQVVESAQRARCPNRNANDAGRRRRRPTAQRATGVSPDQAGNLAAMAATVAGIQIDSGARRRGGHVFASSACPAIRTTSTFNGLGSGISALPPDILATTSINPYPFDVCEGRVQRRADLDSDHSRLELLASRGDERRASRRRSSGPDAAGGGAGASEYTNMRVGGNAAGPIAVDQMRSTTRAYNVGAAVQRTLRHSLNTSATRSRRGGRRPGFGRRGCSTSCGTQRIPAAPTGAARPAVAGCRAGARQRRPDAERRPGTGHSFTRRRRLANYPAARSPSSRGGLLLDDARRTRTRRRSGARTRRWCTPTISGSAFCRRPRSALRRRATRSEPYRATCRKAPCASRRRYLTVDRRCGRCRSAATTLRRRPRTRHDPS